MTDDERPRTRADCERAQRPCPWLLCKHHLVWEVATLTQLEADPAAVLEAMPETCTLDVAERGCHTFADIAEILDVSKQRVQQIEHSAAERLRRRRLPGAVAEHVDGAVAPAGQHTGEVKPRGRGRRMVCIYCGDEPPGPRDENWRCPACRAGHYEIGRSVCYICGAETGPSYTRCSDHRRASGRKPKMGGAS